MDELVLRGEVINGPDVDNQIEMENYRKKFSKSEFSRHIKLCQWQAVALKYINQYQNGKNPSTLSFIDVGGRKGENKYYSTGFGEYKILEIDKREKG